MTAALRWGLAASVALTITVPSAAEAATSSSTSPIGAVRTSLHTAVAGLTAPLTRVATVHPAATRSATTSTAATQAPAGEADAYGAKVGGLLSLSHTHASASSKGESSTANPVEILGTTPAPLGGTQAGPGSNSGSLFDSGTTPMGRVAIAPWAVENNSNASGNRASALADILLVDLGTPGSAQSASLRVLQSTSEASWTPTSSSAQGTTDGAILDAGGPNGLAIDVLHSETSSSGAGSSYLVSINRTEIGTSGQTNGSCQLTLPSLLSLSCLTASGGPGVPGADGTTVQTSSAGVLSATLGGTSGLPAGLLQASSSSGRVAEASKTPAASGPPPAGGNPAPAPKPATASSPGAVASHGPLAFTGSAIADALGLAGGAIALGLVLVETSKRRRRTA
jgi:hypothetical protein